MAVTLASELTEAETQLTAVRAAIARAVNAQAYTIGEQSVSRQRLTDLREMEGALLRRINAITAAQAGGRSGGAMQASFR
jgi:hypothetical protein